jgi:catechol 2,3-dioxygenase-like lactoylglutathione lyase family enzyme
MNNQGIGSNIVCQVGLIVRDIERSAEAYSRVFGMQNPEVIVTDGQEISHAKYRGEPMDARAKLAFFNMGQITLELIEPIGGPSTWQEFLDRQGEGVHHIAFFVEDTDRAVASLEQHDIAVIQQGDYTGGRYTYVDSAPALGVILELLENFE